jgi:hypothetical protein
MKIHSLLWEMFVPLLRTASFADGSQPRVRIERKVGLN